MSYLLLLFCILLFSLQALLFKEFNSRFMKSYAHFYLFNVIYFALSVVVFSGMGIHLGGIKFYTLVLGTSFGFVMVISTLLFMKAMETGPLSYSSLFYSAGLLIPVLCGLVFWQESMGLMQVLGLILLFIVFYLGSDAGSGHTSRVNFKWLLYCLASFLSNGGLMTLAKEHQILLPGMEEKEFLAVSFIAAAIVSMPLFLASKKSSLFECFAMFKSRRLVLLTAGACITTVFGNLFVLKIAASIPAVMLFPAINGGVVVFSTLGSVLFFKEKISRKGLIGIVLGIVSIILLSL